MAFGTILVVDDEPKIVRFVRLNLEAEGFDVKTAADGETALAIAQSTELTAIILDVMLPGKDGFEILRRIRDFSSVPVLLLTARDEMEDKVHGLDLGADDYLTKPFGADELLARLRAVIRRSRAAVGPSEPPTFAAGDLEIDFGRRLVRRGGTPVRLSPTEYKLLYHLATNAEKTLLHEDLVRRVWGAGFERDTDNLRTYIRYLRQKLEANPARPNHIVTEPGIGYRFQKGIRQESHSSAG